MENQTNAHKLQNQVFAQVLSKYPGRSEAVDALVELLSVSKNSIYRRLRNDTLLSPDELHLIAAHFGISIDNIIHRESDLLPFSYNLFTNNINDFDTYLNQIHENLRTVLNIPDVYIYYASQEIPVFQYFFFPELLAFKLFVYGQTAWNFDYLKDTKFNPSLAPPSAIEKGKECVRLYSMLPSKDLWSLAIVDNTLHQIEFTALDNRFEDREMALILCDQVEKLLKRAQTMAEYGKKFFLHPDQESAYAEFDLYYNEMVSTNNTIMVKTPRGSMLYTTINNPNFLLTTNQRFCRHMENWFNMIVSRSTSISVHSVKERTRYFNRLFRKVDHTRKRIELMLEDGVGYDGD